MNDYEYKLWKGEVGPGLLLRESIARDNEERMATAAAKQPAPKQIKIDADVIGLLKTGTWSTTNEGDPALVMPMTKDRKLYEKTAKVLTALGGKWSRKHAATIFTEDEDAETAVREACESGVYVDSKQLFQFFETPESVSNLMLEELCFKPGIKYTVLEPSAGHGALICAVASVCVTDGPDIELTAVELDPKKEGRLKEMVGSDSQVTKRLVIGDFTSMNPAGVESLGLFDRIIMNPPFTRGQDMRHTRHAFNFLKPGGVMVAILSPAFEYRSDNDSKLFRDWLALRQSADYATWVPLPDGSFKSAGTNVRTVMLTIRKGK